MPTPIADPVFDAETLKRRRGRLQAVMVRRELSALVIFGSMENARNIEYLLGMSAGYGALVLPVEGEPVLLARPRAFLPTLRKQLDIRVEDGGLDFAEPLIQELKDLCGPRSRIGLVELDSLHERGIPHQLYLSLRDAMPNATFDTVTDDVERVRMSLDAEEQPWLATAAGELDRVITHLISLVEVGKRVDQLFADTRRWAAEEGVRLDTINGLAAPMSGPETTHDKGARTRVLQPGDYIYFESNVWLGPYKAYRSFPIALGKPPADMKRMFDFTVELAKDVAATLKTGNHTSDVVRLGERIAEAGLHCNGPLAYGPGLGGWQMICEPRFDGYRPPTEITYETGMWLQCGPHMCNEDASRSAITGDVVLIGEDGAQVQGSPSLQPVIID
jgi:Xaa-Pro aminopeptidase